MRTRYIDIDPRKLRLLELNARFMKNETFRRLVENIRSDGTLTQTPFCAALDYYTEGDESPRDADGDVIWEVLSGNHRVQAAIAAGLEVVTVQVTDDPLTRPQRLAIQLGHNAISGEDDPAILRQLYAMIEGVDWKAYSGLDDKTLGLMDKAQVAALGEANLAFQTLMVVFLPNELERVKAVMTQVRETIKAKDSAVLARFADYDRYLDTLDDIGAANGVKNSATVLMLMLDLVERHLDELREGWVDGATGMLKHKARVPFSSIFGTTQAPSADMATVVRALDLMVARGEVENRQRWQALVQWALSYLGEEKEKKGHGTGRR